MTPFLLFEIFTYAGFLVVLAREPETVTPLDSSRDSVFYLLEYDYAAYAVLAESKDLICAVLGLSRLLMAGIMWVWLELTT